MSSQGQEAVTGICPLCGVARNLRLATTKRTERDDEGVERVVRVTSTHCEVCQTFISSDEEILEGDE